MLDGSGDTFVFLASTNSGKTYLAKEIAKLYARHFDTITIMSGTSFSKDWEELGIPPVKVSIEKLEAFLAMAEEQVSTMGKPGKHLLIMDDIMSVFPTSRNKIFTALTTAGRHFGITTFLLIQYYKFITPTIRSNTTGWFIMADQLPMVINGVHEITPYNRKEFEKRYRELKRYDFVFIDANSTVTFSQKVIKDGSTIVRPILTGTQRLRNVIRQEAQMRVRDADREPVYEERSRWGDQLPTTSQVQSIAPDNRAPAQPQAYQPIASPFITASSSSSSYTQSSAYNPAQSSAYNVVPTLTTTAGRERETASAPEFDRGYLFGDSYSSRPEPPAEGRDTRTRESGGTGRPQIRSSIF